MERIIVLIDPSGIETASLEFACYLTRLTNSKLTGLFLHGTAETRVSEIAVTKSGQLGRVDACERISLEHPSTSVQQNKFEFIHYCENRGMRWKPDMADAHNMEEIIVESRFADLLIVNTDASFSPEPETVPSDLVTDLLKDAECPVFIAPLSFDPIDEIVFAYDGSASCVFAIRQFTHLFPQFQDKKVTFLEVNDDVSNEIEHRDKITNYLKMHYSSIGYRVLKGEPENELFSHFLEKKNVMVVIGAFGKKAVTSIFRRSTAHLLLKTTGLPIFVTHR